MSKVIWQRATLSSLKSAPSHGGGESGSHLIHGSLGSRESAHKLAHLQFSTFSQHTHVPKTQNPTLFNGQRDRVFVKMALEGNSPTQNVDNLGPSE